MNTPSKKPIPKIDPAKLAAALAAAKAFQERLAANKAIAPAKPATASQPEQQQLLINNTPRERISLGEFDINKCVTELDKSNMTHAIFLQRLHQLDEALLNRDPKMRDHLKEIHTMMQQHDEIVSLLSNEEVARIMAAQQSHTNTTLVQAVVKKTSTATKAASAKAAKMTMADL